MPTNEPVPPTATVAVDVFHVAARRLLDRLGLDLPSGLPFATREAWAVEIAKDLRGSFAYACDHFAAPLYPENFLIPVPPRESGNYQIVSHLLKILRGGLERASAEAKANGATEFPPRA